MGTTNNQSILRECSCGVPQWPNLTGPVNPKEEGKEQLQLRDASLCCRIRQEGIRAKWRSRVQLILSAGTEDGHSSQAGSQSTTTAKLTAEHCYETPRWKPKRGTSEKQIPKLHNQVANSQWQQCMELVNQWHLWWKSWREARMRKRKAWTTSGTISK